jgi:hypothetical protein
MNSNWDDNNIKALFAEFGPEDERDAPGFGKVWAAARSRLSQNRRRRCFRHVSALAACLAALSLVVDHRIDRRQGSAALDSHREMVRSASARSTAPALPWQSALLVSQWRAPTDFLLEPPGRSGSASQWLKNIPASESRPNK